MKRNTKRKEREKEEGGISEGERGGEGNLRGKKRRGGGISPPHYIHGSHLITNSSFTLRLSRSFAGRVAASVYVYLS